MSAIDYEDVLNDALELLGEPSNVDNGVIRYGPLTLTVAPKEGKANTLLADHLFSPAIYLAERIERGLLGAKASTVLELGAGTALPSLLLSTLPKEDAPFLVIVTDYPDPIILDNATRNVERNASHFQCRVLCQGYEWGKDTLSILKHLPDTHTGFDVMILSDLLHFHSSHDDLILSIKLLLLKTDSSRVHIGAGSYTPPHVCDNFVTKARQAGLEIEEIVTNDEDRNWYGQMEVSNLSREDLAVRKFSCRYWIGRWDVTLL